ncbi:MAG TPA: DUF3300 domain-containing protein, partial [Woeseiaceae bacterium]|nr:DUF3300 domain-containing protein [Woeseiaceae bacterium]
MNNKNSLSGAICVVLGLLLAGGPIIGYSQVPVDEDGNVVGAAETNPVTGDDPAPLLSGPELQRLVGPIALYPDDLLAVVLPASTYPLQVVKAGRFLKDLESDPSLKPDSDWDDSIVALVNYPEVVELLNEDLDWTWQLGEAVVAQQTDVLNAVEEFRNQAYAAGNLKSDEHQNVTRKDDVIEIEPVNEEVIYVPYYEPERVVVYQPQPVYYYYPRPYPIYYYPYPAGYAFSSGYFWGVTTAFTIGWGSGYVRVFHPSYYGHPYYGSYYWDNWWYRRPSIHSYNTVYINNQTVVNNHYYQGDSWQSRNNVRLRASDQRITRNRFYPNGQARGSVSNANQVSVRQSQNHTAAHTRSGATSNDNQLRTRVARDGTATTDRRVQVRPAERDTDSVRAMRETIVANRASRQSSGQLVSPRDNIVAPRPDTTGLSGDLRRGASPGVNSVPRRHSTTTNSAINRTREAVAERQQAERVVPQTTRRLTTERNVDVRPPVRRAQPAERQVERPAAAA